MTPDDEDLVRRRQRDNARVTALIAYLARTLSAAPWAEGHGAVGGRAEGHGAGGQAAVPA